MAEELVLQASMKDDLSRPLERVEDKVDDVTAATKRLDTASAGANSTLDKSRTKYGATARAAESLARGNGATARTAAQADSRLTKLARGGLSKVADVARSGARYLTYGATALVAGGVAAVGFGIKTAASMQTAKIGFTTMLGSAKKANSFLKDLSAFAAKTPFEFPELQTAASSLISAGINADKVIPIMTTLGNVTSGMGTGSEGVQRATVALQQMSAAGRITGEDLNQLRDAGIPVYDLLAKATGKSKAEVVALAQAGKLGSKELGQMMKALETGKGLERFSGLMDKQSESLSGVASTFKDTLGMGLATALQPAIPVLTDLTLAASDLVGKGMGPLTAGIQTVVDKGKELYASGQLQQWAQEGKDRVVEFWHAVGPLVGDLLTLGKDALPAVGDTLGTVVGLIEAGAQVLHPLINGFNHLPASAKKALILGAAIYFVSGKLDELRTKGVEAIEKLKGVDKRMALMRVGAGLAGGAMLTFAGDVGQSHQALGEMMTVAGSMATGFAAAGPVGLALGALGGVFSVFTQHSRDAAAAQDALDSAGKRVAETLDKQTGAMGELTKATAAKELADSGAFDAARKVGASYQDVLDASLGNVAAQRRVSKATDDYMASADKDVAASRSNNGAKTAGAGGAKAASEYKKAADTVGVLTAAVGATNNQIDKQRHKIEQVNAALGSTPKDVSVSFDVNTAAGQARLDRLNASIDKAIGKGAARGGKGSAGRTGQTAQGDTATRHGWGGAGSSRLGRTLAAHSAVSGRLGGGYRVTNALTGGGGHGGGSGDHQSGRAVDVTGRNLPAYAREVRASGGYARIHGDGPRKHVHAVMGDTATPHRGSVAGSGSGSRGISIDVGGVHIHGSGLSRDELAAAVQEAFDAIIRESEETTA